MKMLTSLMDFSTAEFSAEWTVRVGPNYRKEFMGGGFEGYVFLLRLVFLVPSARSPHV